jgi:membrane dipeptidase
MGLISASVDRLLHTTAVPAGQSASAAATALHAGGPVVDLVVGSALFRNTFVTAAGRGHVDLPRLRAAGVNVVGMTIATRFPDLRGTLSRHHFRSLGAPPAALASSLLLAEWVIGRIEQWSADSAGELIVVRDAQDLQACLRPGGPVGMLLGVQGGHALDGDLANLDRLLDRGVRMFAPAHVMDNAYVGSATGKLKGGLTPLGRELVAELERRSVLVDLAHMSLSGIDDTLGLLTEPPMLSHTGLVSLAARSSRWRRYSPASRNVPDSVARAVGEAGGVVGIVLSTRLLGGETIDDAVATFSRAVEVAGVDGVAIGSDMDGALRTVVDAAGLPLLTDGLLAAGMPSGAVAGILGANAVRLLSGSLGAWRRGRDSNPRTFRSTVFKTAAINHSATSPAGQG